MPVEFLSDEMVAAYGTFTNTPTRGELERFFFLDDADRQRVRTRRVDHTQLGFGVQLGTVRFLSVFLEDPTVVPSAVVDYVAEQLGIENSSVLEAYTERVQTAYRPGPAVLPASRRATTTAVYLSLEPETTCRPVAP